MQSSILVAAQVSSLFPSSHALNVPVKTRRPRLHNSSQSSSDSEHAIYAEIYNIDVTGSILLRVIHDGHILELISLSTDAPPLRFIFADPVVPNPTVLGNPNQEIHIIAVTTAGSLFRIVVPVPDAAPLWQSTTIPSISIREYLVKKWRADWSAALVHVQSTYWVTLTSADGAILRLDAEQVGQDDEDDQWSERMLYHGTFLNTLASFLQPSVPGGSAIVSIASRPPPSDIGRFWTLSRDRTLRLWDHLSGCILEKTLSPLPSTRGTAAGVSSPLGSKTSTLLHEAPQRLLRLFKPERSQHYHLLVFIPTESSPVSGGYFSLFDTANDQLTLVTEFECSSHTVHSHLVDFVATPHWLYTLWDKAGQSVVDKLPISEKMRELDWVGASYPPESELTPAYLDELLLSPGSLADKFFEAIIRPGIFSSYTLQTALTQYIAACGSLPWPTDPRLDRQYATTAEAIASVVGCTVQLNRDPQTGALLYDNYWNALKRDWEGFIARCREIERSARWPLAIGFADPQGDMIVIERERISSLVGEDHALRLHRTLSQPKHESVSRQYGLLEILWTLRSKLGPRAVLAMEARVVDIVHQEIAFPYADIIQDTALRLDLRSQLDDGFVDWLAGRLEGVEDLEPAIQAILDVVGGFETDVKREEEEVELLLPVVNEELRAALTAGYATFSLNARYDLALALMLLLFFSPNVVPLWEPARLAEIFVVFRGIALLRFIARQPAGPAISQNADVGAEEDIIARMRSMNVSTSRIQHEPSHSLLHRLLTQFRTHGGLPTAAHRFIDATGLLQSTSPALATEFEVEFCEKLRALGYRDAARELLTWLPRTPAVSYVLSRVWLDESRYEDAAAALEVLGGSFGPETRLSTEDREALAAVLSNSELFDSQFGFYLHAAKLFGAASVTVYEVLFSQHAISTAPSRANTSALWQTVIKGFVDLELYDDAYAALMSTPYEKLKRDCVSALVQKMCEEHAVDRLMSYNFAGVVDEVEASLSFKARNADPQIRPFYSKILYTWYISRGDYRNAAATMYQRARRFATLTQGVFDDYTWLAQLQLEAYAVSINALSLIEAKSAWFILPITVEHTHEPRKRRKLSKHIPESRYTGGTRDVEVVELRDIQYEYALLVAQLELVQNDPRLLASIELLRSPSGVVSKLAQLGKFDLAIATAISLDVDMSELFAQLTTQCLRLARNPDLGLEGHSSDWLLTDKVSSWPGTPVDRAWRYLRQALERHDGPQSSFLYSKVALETILSIDRSSQSSPWLISLIEDRHPEYLIRTYLRYEVLDAALECALSMLRKDNTKLSVEQPRTPSSTWLPYTLIDQLLLAASSQENASSRIQTLQSDLRTEISNRMKRVQRLTQQS